MIHSVFKFKTLFWIVLTVVLFFFHTKGYTDHDEGWILNSAKRILDGEVPYRDFMFIYTPGSIFAVAAIFKALGQSILAARILAIATSLTSIFFLIKILTHIKVNLLLIALTVLTFILWGPIQINFTWPVMFCIAIGLGMIYQLMLYEKTKELKFLFLAGFLSALVLLFKQNFGLAVLINNALVFLFLRSFRNPKPVSIYVFGFIIPIFLFILYLVINGTLSIFINQMYFLLVEKILFEGMLSTPFIYPSPIIKQVIKAFFYLSPAILSIYAFYLIKARAVKYFYVPAFILLYYLFSIRPTTDIVHLAPNISLAGLAISVIYKYTQGKLKIFSFVLFAIFIFLGMYMVIFRGYYRWEAPILESKFFIKNERVNIWVDGKYKNILSDFIPRVGSIKDDYMFVYHFAPMNYFVADKRNPTRYDYIPAPLLNSEVQKEIIADLRKKNTGIIITGPGIRREKSEISKFITNYYKPQYSTPDYILWLKNISNK